MTTLRFQSIGKTKKSGFRCQLRVSVYRENTTLKVGDAIPYQRNTTDLFRITEISNETKYSSDFENAYLVVSNSVKSYKVPYKGAFSINNNELSEESEGWDANRHYNKTITEIK